MSEVRNQLHLIKGEDLTGSQIKSACGEVYLSSNESNNQLDTNAIVEFTRSIKVPYYGIPIPNSATIVQADGSGGGIIPLFTPASNVTYQWMCADVTNAGAGSISVDFGVTDGAGAFIKMANISPSAGGGQNAIEPRNLFYFDSNVYPAFRVVSGTASDALVTMAYSTVIQ